MNDRLPLEQFRIQTFGPRRAPGQGDGTTLPYGSIAMPLLSFPDCGDADVCVQATGYSVEREDEAGVDTTLPASAIFQGDRVVPLQLLVGWRGGDASQGLYVGIGAGMSMTVSNPRLLTVSLIAPAGTFASNPEGGSVPQRGDALDAIVNVTARATGRRETGSRLTLLDVTGPAIGEGIAIRRVVPPFADEVEFFLGPWGLNASAIGVPSIRFTRGTTVPGFETIMMVPVAQRVIVPDAAVYYEITPDPDAVAVVSSQWRLAL